MSGLATSGFGWAGWATAGLLVGAGHGACLAREIAATLRGRDVGSFRLLGYRGLRALALLIAATWSALHGTPALMVLMAGFGVALTARIVGVAWIEVSDGADDDR